MFIAITLPSVAVKVLPVLMLILAGCGMISSLLFAAFPCWFLIEYQSSVKTKVLFKTLAGSGFAGWFWICSKCSYEFGWILSLCVLGLISGAASRGEELARLKGIVEEHRGKLRYVKKQGNGHVGKMLPPYRGTGRDDFGNPL